MDGGAEAPAPLLPSRTRRAVGWLEKRGFEGRQRVRRPYRVPEGLNFKVKTRTKHFKKGAEVEKVGFPRPSRLSSSRSGSPRGRRGREEDGPLRERGAAATGRPAQLTCSRRPAPSGPGQETGPCRAASGNGRIPGQCREELRPRHRLPPRRGRVSSVPETSRPRPRSVASSLGCPLFRRQGGGRSASLPAAICPLLPWSRRPRRRGRTAEPGRRSPGRRAARRAGWAAAGRGVSRGRGLAGSGQVGRGSSGQA